MLQLQAQARRKPKVQYATIKELGPAGAPQVSQAPLFGQLEGEKRYYPQRSRKLQTAAANRNEEAHPKRLDSETLHGCNDL